MVTKTRIKITTNRKGIKSYIPQYRCMFMWSNMETTCWQPTYYSLVDAQQRVDQFLYTEKTRDDNKRNSKIVKTEYVKYP